MKKKRETIAEKNARFWALDKRNKRIAIAKDVIEQLSAGKIDARKGVYIRLPFNLRSRTGKLDAILRKETTPCDCCGIGACFISLINLGDKIRVQDVMMEGVFGDGLGISSSKMRDFLRQIFSPKQITYIETAFEMNEMIDSEVDEHFRYSGDYHIQIRNCISFGQYFQSSYTRLEGIMKNIIKNRGTFRPDKP